MHIPPALSAPLSSSTPIPAIPSPSRQAHQPVASAHSGVSTEFPALSSGRHLGPSQRNRLRPAASDRPVWSEGRGPNPAPPFLIRWHTADDAPRHDQAATGAEALALARDARDATSADVAVYRLWSVLPD